MKFFGIPSYINIIQRNEKVDKVAKDTTNQCYYNLNIVDYHKETKKKDLKEIFIILIKFLKYIGTILGKIYKYIHYTRNNIYETNLVFFFNRKHRVMRLRIRSILHIFFTC